MKPQTQNTLHELLRDRLQTTYDDIANFCDRWNITELALFGSVLRDDFRPESDIDILVTYQPAHHLRWRDWLAAQNELEQMFGRNVDIVEKALLTNPYRQAEILKTHQVIYTDE
jgi:hypothetical protein